LFAKKQSEMFTVILLVIIRAPPWLCVKYEE
jgi:hypothetical protein